MKKGLVIGVTLIMGLSLAACDNSSSSSSSNEKATVKKTATPKYYFKDNVVKIHDLKIKITKTKIIQPGQPGNVDGDKAVFAVWYDTTNLTDKDLDPTSAWMAVFTAIQDNDKNSINELEVASLPDDQYLDSQTETIKKNGTVSNPVAYTLSDTTTPVQLKASKGVDGKVLGTKTYKIVENN